MAEPILVRRPRTDEDEEYMYRFMHTRNPVQTILRQLQTILTHEFYDRDEEIRRLERRVSRLESKLISRSVMTRGNKVYERLRPTLERQYLDKIVAIDTERGEIAGVGDTIEEAYHQARVKCPDKRQFYFKRVGKSYVERIR